MTDKELQILNEIKKFYQKNMLMPTIRYLKDKLNYKSNYSIQVYLVFAILQMLCGGGRPAAGAQE